MSKTHSTSLLSTPWPFWIGILSQGTWPLIISKLLAGDSTVELLFQSSLQTFWKNSKASRQKLLKSTNLTILCFFFFFFCNKATLCNVLRHHLYLPEGNIQVRNDQGVLRRLVSCLKWIELTYKLHDHMKKNIASFKMIWL